MSFRIMLVDDNEDFLNNLCSFFKNDINYEVVATAKDGEQAIELFSKVKPDVMVLDLVMPGKDGFAVLSTVDKGASKIVVVSALNQDVFVIKALEMGADYYMMKPCSLKDLDVRIREMMHKQPFERRGPILRGNGHSLEERITNIFMSVGIPAHIKGYQFLREAIKMAVDMPDIINSITKRLYPEVAERFQTTPSKVERAIRHAIEVAWNRGKIENINSLFGVRVYSSAEKPTNGEFIALVADKMLLESV